MLIPVDAVEKPVSSRIKILSTEGTGCIPEERGQELDHVRQITKTLQKDPSSHGPHIVRFSIRSNSKRRMGIEHLCIVMEPLGYSLDDLRIRFPGRMLPLASAKRFASIYLSRSIIYIKKLRSSTAVGRIVQCSFACHLAETVMRNHPTDSDLKPNNVLLRSPDIDRIIAQGWSTTSRHQRYQWHSSTPRSDNLQISAIATSWVDVKSEKDFDGCDAVSSIFDMARIDLLSELSTENESHRQTYAVCTV